MMLPILLATALPDRGSGPEQWGQAGSPFTDDVGLLVFRDIRIKTDDISDGGLDAPLHLHVCPAGGLIHAASTTSFATVTGAQRAARAAIAAGHRQDIVVELCAGPHAADEMLTFGPADVPPPRRLHKPAAAAATTTYRGAADGRALLDSGVPITGWARATGTGKDGVLKAPLPAGAGASRQLWVDGVRAARAHSNPYNCSGGPSVPGDIASGGPDGKCQRTICGVYGGPKKLCGFASSDVHTASFSNTTGYLNVPATLPALSSKPLEQWLPGAELVYGKGGSGASWAEPRCSVQSVRKGSTAGTVDIVMTQPCWGLAQKPNLGGTAGQGVRFPSDVENSLDLLDEAGEWYGDFKAGVIYYKPLSGQTVAGGFHAVLGSVPRGGEGTAVAVERATTGLRFENLGFAHQTWLSPSSDLGFVDMQSGYYQTAVSHRTSYGWSDIQGVPGALALHGVQDVVVSNCSFEHLGLSGVVVDGGSQRVTIQGSRFADTSGSAISLGNVSKAVMSTETQDGHFVVQDNHIRNTGAEFQGCAGVVAGYVAHTQIVHNDIANTSNGAVCLGWGWGDNGGMCTGSELGRGGNCVNSMQGNNVSYNRIQRSNTELFDCGSIYTLSNQKDSVVSYNWIENQVLLFGSLYHDAASAGFHTHHNVVVGGPMWLYLQWCGATCPGMGPVHDLSGPPRGG
jgi:hypothetical protein